MKKKWYQDAEFLKLVFSVALPIMIQNGITNFVSLLDNIMIGQVGTEQMSGIAIVNQLLVVFYLSIFGGISGAGIFTAQFFGTKDHKGIRHTFRYKFYVCLGLCVLGIIVFLLFGDRLILLYLHGEEEKALLSTLAYGKTYLAVMLLGIFPFCAEQLYTSTLRECGETMVSMRAGITAVVVNLVLNYLLIFGSFGFPRLGVAGAAVATVISRYVQAAMVIFWTHRHADRMPFITGAYRTLTLPKSLAGNITKKGLPLLVNEFLWSAGMAVLMQCYSLRGLSAVASLNISSTISNLFNVVFIALGCSVAILVGPLLGAGKMEEARELDQNLIWFTTSSCILLGLAMVLLAPLFPLFYNTTEEVRSLATLLIRICGACMPIYGFTHATYFTLRSGGKTIITFLFDSAFLFGVSVPVAYVLSRYTGLAIGRLYLSVQLLDLIKCALGYWLVKKGTWLQNIVSEGGGV